jgi:hypothetical protein
MENPVIESMSPDEKEWFALAIVGMIWADGRVDKAELAYLKNIIGFLKDKALIGSMLSMVKEGNIPPLLEIAIDQKKAAYIMSQLTMLSIVDEELAPNEEEFLRLVTERLGLPAGVSEKFLAHARKQVGGQKYPARLTVGSKESEVKCFGLSENECLIYSIQAVNPQARVSFKFYQESESKDQAEFLEPIIGKSSWCRPIKSRFGNFVLKVEFQQHLQEPQGLELIQDADVQNEKIKKTLEASNKSLLGFYVQCRVCGKKNIPYWFLRTKTMNTRNNIFGIPVYQKPKAGKEFCDYNLIQITVCPQCLFASNQMDFFNKQSGKKVEPPFDNQAFSHDWQKGLPLREQATGKSTAWLGKEKRSHQQAMASYELALMTSDQLAVISKDKQALEHQRRSVSFLLIQAELAMNKKEREKAESCIEEAESRLENLFTNLTKVPVIRSAFVLAIIKIYFKKYEQAGDYLNILKNYDRNNIVSAGSPEYQALNQVMGRAELAWQDRADYAHDALENFHHEDVG